MKKTINLFGLLFFFFITSLNAQTQYYYYKGEKNYIPIDFSGISIISNGKINILT